MKEYSFPDPDNDGYDIIVPKDIVKDITLEYFRKTFYWPIAILSGIIGFLLGVISK